jgi:hypothetical protein
VVAGSLLQRLGASVKHVLQTILHVEHFVHVDRSKTIDPQSDHPRSEKGMPSQAVKGQKQVNKNTRYFLKFVLFLKLEANVPNT